MQPELRGCIHANALLLPVSPTSHSSSSTNVYTPHASLQLKSFATSCSTPAGNTQQHRPMAAVARTAAHKADGHGELPLTPRCDSALRPSTTPCRSSLRTPPSPRRCSLVVSLHASSTMPSPQHHRLCRAHTSATGRHCSGAPRSSPSSSCLRLPGRLSAHAASTPPSFR